MTKRTPLPRRLQRILQAIADRHIGAVEQAFLDSLDAAVGRVDTQRLLSALRSGDLTEAVEAIGVTNIETEMRRRVFAALHAASTEAARASAQGTGIGVDLRFDLVNREAVRWAKRRGAMLVREVTHSARNNIRGLVANGLRGVFTVRETAVAIRPLLQAAAKRTLGLTQKQYQWVENYRTELSGQMRATERVRAGEDITEVARELHKRPETVRKWIRQRLTPELVERRVEQYAARKLRERALTISRTETMDAQSAGQRIMWRAAESQGLMTFDIGVKQYYDTPAGRLIGPTAHPKCRCTEVVRRVGRFFRRFWVIAQDERTCKICRQIPKMNPLGVGLPDERMEAREQRLAA